MSKYPKCVYSIGNEFEHEFEHEEEKCVFLWKGQAGESVVSSIEGSYLTARKTKELILVGTTAETLAELARDKGHTVSIDFSPYKSMSFVKVWFGIKDWSYKQNKDEPLNQFFLRVAKERNYIK